MFRVLDVILKRMLYVKANFHDIRPILFPEDVIDMCLCIDHALGTWKNGGDFTMDNFMQSLIQVGIFEYRRIIKLCALLGLEPLGKEIANEIRVCKNLCFLYNFL